MDWDFYLGNLLEVTDRIARALEMQRGIVPKPLMEPTPSSAAEPPASSPFSPATLAGLNLERELRRKGEAELAHRVNVAEERLARLEARAQEASPQPSNAGEDLSAEGVLGLLKRLSASSLVSHLETRTQAGGTMLVSFRLPALPTAPESAETAPDC